ncbi:hypothetical protein Leryth_022783 [Lithospermum erythrorhizon]|nr:hypothetical protein Leryth_022783 [Lithospermum erythrorhizon]
MGAAVDSLDPVVDGATQKSELTRNKSSSVNSKHTSSNPDANCWSPLRAHCLLFDSSSVRNRQIFLSAPLRQFQRVALKHPERGMPPVL